MRRSGRRSVAALALVAVSIAAGCADRSGLRATGSHPGFRGPIVVISLAALGAGSVGGEASVTPRLDRFVAESTWSGTGVAAASWSTGSLASMWTGVPPSVHGVGHPAHPWLRRDLPTLAEALAGAGFATCAFYASPWSGPRSGLERGFDASRPLHRAGPERWLAALPEGPSLTWIELPLPGPDPTAEEAADAAARQDPAATRQTDAAVRQEAGSLAGATVRPLGDRLLDADRRLGRLLDALGRSGRDAESIVIVLGDHGEAPRDGETVPAGLDLTRDSVAVPLAIRLPDALRPRLRAPAGATVGLDRVPATLLELAGVRPSPSMAPSLLRPSAWAALSEVWFANGYHEIGLYEDGHQLRWRCRFAAADPGFDAAWREALGPDGGLRYGELVARLQADFRARPECVGGEELTLEAWPADGGGLPVHDDALRDRMIERLRTLRHFPPVWSVAPAPPRPALRRREFGALAGWGLPLPAQWLATGRAGGSPG